MLGRATRLPGHWLLQAPGFPAAKVAKVAKAFVSTSRRHVIRATSDGTGWDPREVTEQAEVKVAAAAAAAPAGTAPAGAVPAGRLRGTSRLVLEKPYEELNLVPIQEQVGGVRVRQHVNPLKASLMEVQPPDFYQVFVDPELPLAVDIGCGSGRLLLLLAKRNENLYNFIGLDIRDQLVDRGNKWARELSLTNASFLVANATRNLGAILAAYPGTVRLVTILCPDPQFKNRYRKRRIVQQRLVETIVKYLEPGGEVFVQSDVYEVAMDMQRELKEYSQGLLQLSPLHKDKDACSPEGWLLKNPLGIPTEREIHALANGGQMYRAMYVRQ